MLNARNIIIKAKCLICIAFAVVIDYAITCAEGREAFLVVLVHVEEPFQLVVLEVGLGIVRVWHVCLLVVVAVVYECITIILFK